MKVLFVTEVGLTAWIIDNSCLVVFLHFKCSLVEGNWCWYSSIQPGRRSWGWKIFNGLTRVFFIFTEYVVLLECLKFNPKIAKSFNIIIKYILLSKILVNNLWFFFVFVLWSFKISTYATSIHIFLYDLIGVHWTRWSIEDVFCCY